MDLITVLYFSLIHLGVLWKINALALLEIFAAVWLALKFAIKKSFDLVTGIILLWLEFLLGTFTWFPTAIRCRKSEAKLPCCHNVMLNDVHVISAYKLTLLYRG